MRGFRIKELPVNHFSRRIGRSKYNIRNRLLKGLTALLVVRWMQKNRLDYKLNKIKKG